MTAPHEPEVPGRIGGNEARPSDPFTGDDLDLWLEAHQRLDSWIRSAVERPGRPPDVRELGLDETHLS